MKKINLLNEIIIVLNSELEQALRSNKEFAITLKGEIKYFPFDPVDILIYQRKITPPAQTALNTPMGRHELLGTSYEVVEDGERIMIKAANAWQDIIDYNVPHCHYDNTTAEGVTQFGDEEIEDMSWMIIDFDVSYTEMIEMLEENADITLVCIEREESHRFSSMGYFTNIEETRKIFFDFCQNIIKEKISKDVDYALELLDEDQREAAEYFKVI